jgi:transcription initiation factor TFIIIB Brf1 subunit/transcription initiation factor TFIIB|nr:MAG TPA: Cell cycle regulatory protein [Caudoviricetes sp.]
MSNKPVTDLERKKIKRLYNKGLSILNISYELNRNKNTIKKYVKEMGLVREIPDLTEQVFGKLTVIELDQESSGRRKWICKCSCGNTVSVREYNLKSGNTKSCGCTRKEKSSVRNLNVKQVKTRDNQGGVYYFQPGEIILKGNYESKGSKVKEYKLSPEELAAYLKELETKKVKRRGE